MLVFAPTLFGQIASRLPTDQIVRVSLRMRDRTVSGRKQNVCHRRYHPRHGRLALRNQQARRLHRPHYQISR